MIEQLIAFGVALGMLIFMILMTYGVVRFIEYMDERR